MDVGKILIRGPNWVGDAVLAIPAIKSVRNRFPKAEITLLVRPWVAGLFTSAPFIDRLWSEAKPAGVGDWTRITRDIRHKRFDLALLLPNSFESALLTLLGGVPRRIGYATDGRRWMLTTAITPPRGLQHQVQYYLDLVKALSADTFNTSIEIQATTAERAAARTLLTAEGIQNGSRLLVLNAGAAYGTAKRWHEGRFGEVGDILSSELGLQVVFIGSDAEKPIAQRIRSRMSADAAILNGKTSLETLIGVLSDAALIITNDSGPMHIAAALGVPTVAVFGSTDERVTGPRGRRVRVVKHPVECSPCLLRECPIDHRCMNGIAVADVCAAARELLESGSSRQIASQ